MIIVDSQTKANRALLDNLWGCCIGHAFRSFNTLRSYAFFLARVHSKVRLPSDVRQYIRAKVAVEAAGGNNTAKSLTMALVF